MTESGVIPPHGGYLGVMTDMDGTPLQFLVSKHGTVFITIATGVNAIYLDKEAREEFMRLWCEAERQAEASVPP